MMDDLWLKKTQMFYFQKGRIYDRFLLQTAIYCVEEEKVSHWVTNF